MNAIDKIIGMWSIDIMYGPGAQEDTMIVFLPNGTGWIEISHYILCELETFYWKCESNGKISILGDVSFESNDVWEKSQINFENIMYEIKNEMTPSGRTMEVVSFSTPLWLSESRFGLVTREIENVELPQFD
jgi:hypothetical protein